MKKVIIKNKEGQQTHGAEMLDPQAWIADGVAGNWWGKPERWVLHKDEPMAEGYDEDDVLEERTVEYFPAIDAVMDDAGAIVQEAIPARTHREVKLRAEYTVEVVDITEAVALEKLSTEALRYLESTDWKVLRHIRQKALGITTSMNDEEYLEFELGRVEAANKVVR
jgi:hypothetical protein